MIDVGLIKEVPRFYSIIVLNRLRETPGVKFDYIPMEALRSIDGIDRVVHEPGATSPLPVGEIKRPWYMHNHQDDNLLVLQGTRNVEIYSPEYGEVLFFSVRPDSVRLNGEMLYDGACMLVWPKNVFHRIQSCEKEGSITINFATRYEGFDIKHEFDVYDVNTQAGDYHVIREGSLDQPDHVNESMS